MPLMFGTHILCPACDGSGKRSQMTPSEKRERARELRAAKRADRDPSPIVKSPCPDCLGLGYVENRPV